MELEAYRNARREVARIEAMIPPLEEELAKFDPAPQVTSQEEMVAAVIAGAAMPTRVVVPASARIRKDVEAELAAVRVALSRAEAAAEREHAAGVRQQLSRPEHAAFFAGLGAKAREHLLGLHRLVSEALAYRDELVQLGYLAEYAYEGDEHRGCLVRAMASFFSSGSFDLAAAGQARLLALSLRDEGFIPEEHEIFEILKKPLHASQFAKNTGGVVIRHNH